MIPCYMCGRLLKKKSEMLDVTIEKDILIYRSYTVCKKCSKKIDKYINFERARNNRRNMCEEHSLL